MTLQDLFVLEEKSITHKTDKEKVRETVKEAVALFKDGHITEDWLKIIAEIAMTVEITESIEKKMSKKAKHFGF